MQIALAQIRIAKWAVVWRRLTDWWLSEFLNLFSEKGREWLKGKARPSLLISASEVGARLDLVSGGTLTPSASASIGAMHGVADQIAQFLRSHDLDPKRVEIGLKLAADGIFSRQVLLPVEAADAIGDIVAQDLVRKTPFKPADIYSDYVALNHGTKIVVNQWIVRRRYVERALEQLNIGIEHLSFVTFDNQRAGEPAPTISLKMKAETRRARFRTLTLGFFCSALVLAALGGGLRYWKQQIEMDRLAEEIVMANKKAQKVRSLVDQLQEKKRALLQVRLQRSELPGLIDIWEEITRVLPLESWLTELRLIEATGKGDEQIAMAGFSSAAPGLVGIVDSSPLLYDAALTSPIAVDPTEGRERFALQAKVKTPDILKETRR